LLKVFKSFEQPKALVSCIINYCYFKCKPDIFQSDTGINKIKTSVIGK